MKFVGPFNPEMLANQGHGELSFLFSSGTSAHGGRRSDMSGAAYFKKECPICGRVLKVRVSYLGKRVACQHCGGHFEACDPETAVVDASQSSILARADELLESASRIHSKAR